MSLLKRHPLIAFFVLAYALSWWPWILSALHLVPTPVFAPGPFVAALVVIALSSGKTGMRAFLRRLLQWRTGLKWYLVALGIPVLQARYARSRIRTCGGQATSCFTWPVRYHR
ncbi:MAG TPA: hypothetical protein VIY29_19955 [Ktedonobacteraceae bacterium]